VNREQQEMALWRESYRASHCFLAQERARDADAAVAQFRQRYPVEPTAPEPTAPEPTAPELTWHDEPLFEKSLDDMFSAWITDYPYPVMVAYFRDDGWAYQVPNRGNHWTPLNGRRVLPIYKPPEPPQ
jgi:hypothetical protein